ncbi:MAG TPA: hypothetical protein VFE65_04375 [Pseudonocardia sp.]|jgi:hypothetical protein|nr:hypothetical protein [Pseudonocardia sp.]
MMTFGGEQFGQRAFAHPARGARYSRPPVIRDGGVDADEPVFTNSERTHPRERKSNPVDR